MQNLKNGWSPVFCFYDGSEAVNQLVSLGAMLIDLTVLEDIAALKDLDLRLF